MNQKSRASADPVLVEVTRGDAIECIHRGAVSVCDSSGAEIAAWGDVARPVFPRSAIKQLQALPLVESGAADAYSVSDAELALACSSHSGEPAHVETVIDWLQRVGLGPEALACGAHLPLGEDAGQSLIREGIEPTPAHNNCSGKHAGMIATAVHSGEPVVGYIAADHPVQKRIRQTVEEMGGVDLANAVSAIDGCSIPTIATPLTALARAMARFADPRGLPPARAEACARIRAAQAAKPFFVAGGGRCDSAVIEVAGEAALVKTGAEGVYCAILTDRKLGIALKIADGAKRAAEVAMLALLRHYDGLSAAQYERLAVFARPALKNRMETLVGEVRPAVSWL